MNGIYVHFPFCLKKCVYCDFISSPISGDSLRFKDYLSAVCKEIDIRKSETSDLSKDITVFFGGGTPTSVPIEIMEDFIIEFKNRFFEYNIREFTCESNPKTVDLKYLKRLWELGVDRLSIGFQSVNDEELVALGRSHSAEDCILAFYDARRAGFSNINVDLMLGIPGQTLSSLGKSLDEVINLRPEHISAYSLILEEGTPLYEMVKKGDITLPEDDIVASMYEFMLSKLEEAGYQRYEVSNFALSNMECEHNKIYWENDLYSGFGVASHSHCPKGIRFSNTSSIEEYINCLNEGKLPITEKEKLELEMQISDAFMLKLRCSEGIDLKKTSSEYGTEVEKIYSKKIEKLIRLELIERNGDIIRLTNKGFLLGNVVFAEFLPE